MISRNVSWPQLSRSTPRHTVVQPVQVAQQTEGIEGGYFVVTKATGFGGQNAIPESTEARPITRMASLSTGTEN